MQKALKKLESHFKGKKLFIVGLKAFILLSPLPFGCVSRVFSPLFYLFMLILGLYGYRQKFHQREIYGENWILRTGFLLGGFFFFQLAPLPRFLLKIVSPSTVETLIQLKETVPAFHSISLVPFKTLETFFHFLVGALFLWLLMHLNLRRREMIGIFNTIVYSAVFQALFGLAKYFAGNRKFFLFFHPQKQDVYSSYLTGTIGNPNHFAFYLELALPLTLAILFVQIDALKLFPSFQERLHQVVDFKNKSLFFLGAVLVFGLSILLTGSRAGIVTMALSLLGFIQLSVYLAGKREIRQRLKWIFISIVLLAAIIGIQNTMTKFMKSPLHSGGRMTRWPDSLEMIQDFPLTGTGFGTYKFAFFLYDSEGIKWSTHAHNDYLEVLNDGGLAGGLVVLFFIWSLFNSYIRQWWKRRHPQIKLLGIGILVSFFAALFHSLFDFSLRIPANMFLVLVLIGVGINLVTYRREQVHTAKKIKQPLISKIVFGGLLVFFSLQLLSHFFLIWGQGSTTAAGRGMLKLSAQIMPLDSDAHLEYGYRLLQDNESRPHRNLLLRGIGALEKAVAHNMLQYNAHYFLAKAYLFADQPGAPYFDKAVRSFKRSGLLRGKNPDISLDTLKVHMSLWQLLEEDDRDFVRKLFEDALGQLNSNQVKSLLELWGLYIKDIEFLEQGLKQYPHFSLEAAQKLTELEMDLSHRQTFLAQYESYWLKYSQQKLKGLLALKSAPLPDLEAFLRRFSSFIIGYHKIVPETQFDRSNYLALKKRLFLAVIRALLTREDGFKYLEQQGKIMPLIARYVQDFSSEGLLNELVILLEKHRFFSRSGIQGQEMRLLILSRMKKYRQLVSEALELKESITFVTSDQEDFYAGILLLLADGYMASGNFVEALNIFETLRPFDSRNNEIFWRLRKLEKMTEGGVLPAPAEGTIRLDSSRDIVDLENRNSRIILVNSLRKFTTVYPVQENSLEIHAGDRIKPKLAGKHLVQVLVDGDLAAEQYLGDWLSQPLKVKLDSTSMEKILKIHIKII